MRVIAGRLGGRRFASSHGNKTHPMSDKMRGALFNMLGDIAGLTVLDAFAGTGALGYEAISRGAESVVLVENDRSAQRTIVENINNLQLSDHVHLVRASVSAWLHTSQATFDLVLIDPPYDNLQMAQILPLSERVNTGGILVLSYPAALEPPIFDGFTLLKQKNYAGGSLCLFERVSSL